MKIADLVLWSPGDPLDNGERWTSVPGYESAYLISTLGRVMRILGGKGSTPGRIMKCTPNKDGYPTVCLTVDGVGKTFNLHKLVAHVFHGDPPVDIAGDFEVHHKPNPKTGIPDRTDCRAFMLEYVSAYENEMEKQHRYYSGKGR